MQSSNIIRRTLQMLWHRSTLYSCSDKNIDGFNQKYCPFSRRLCFQTVFLCTIFTVIRTDNSSKVNFRNSKAQRTTGFKELGNVIRRGCGGGNRKWEERKKHMCVCVFLDALTSELRPCMLWRAGHPVELFSAKP